MKKTVLLMLGAIVLFSGAAYAETAKDAYRALKKLEARTQAGINYRDYRTALGEAKLDYNLYVESSNAQREPAITKSLKDAMACYALAMMAWEQIFSGPPGSLSLHYIKIDSQLGGLINTSFPGEDRSFFVFEDEHTKKQQVPFVWAEDFVAVAFRQASKSLGEVSGMLAKQDTAPTPSKPTRK